MKEVRKEGRKADWIRDILCKNCLPKHVTEGAIKGRMEMTGRRGGRHKQLLYDLNKTRRGF
jgi:hypothetical protein